MSGKGNVLSGRPGGYHPKKKKNPFKKGWKKFTNFFTKSSTSRQDEQTKAEHRGERP